MNVHPYFLLVRCGGQTIGGIMFFKKRMFGMIDSYEIRGGPLYVKGNRELVIRSILKALKKKEDRSMHLLFVPFPLINTYFGHIFRTQGYHPYPFRTIIIDLHRPLEDIWQALDKNIRWSIRKAERLGLKVKVASTWQEWEEYYKLHVLHARQKQYPTSPHKFFEEMFKLDISSSMAPLFLAKYGKRIVAGSLNIVYRQDTAALQGASVKAFLSYKPNTLVDWKSIEWAKENGVITYDMGGLPAENVPYLRGVYDYKKRWGGRLQWYYYYLNRRLIYSGMHMIRTNSFAWKIYLSLRNLKVI